MEQNQSPIQPTLENEQSNSEPQLAHRPNLSPSETSIRISDCESKKQQEAGSDGHITASSPGEANALDGRLPGVKSARSSRSDMMYDQTPPEFDVCADRPSTCQYTLRPIYLRHIYLHTNI